MVIAPLRPDPVGLAATEKATAPLPLPPLLATVIQLALLTACQAHSSSESPDGLLCPENSIFEMFALRGSLRTYVVRKPVK
jgi:hypothetical protein